MITNQPRGRKHEYGATALLVVTFSILILTTISIGFMRLVVQDQNRTNNDELSRGAYDAALAGVEDGKRVLQACLQGGSASSAYQAIISKQCNTIHRSKVLSTSDSDSNQSEVLIQNNSGISGGFDQAYTCVKIDRETADYQGSLAINQSSIIPLDTTGPFSQITVSWFDRVKNATAPLDIPTPVAGNMALPQANKWSAAGKVRPPILRVQLMQFSASGFKLGDFDENGGGSTLFLYPSSVGLTAHQFAVDARRSPSNNLLQTVRCGGSAAYVCSTTLSVQNPVNGDANSRQAYLRVTALYGETDFALSFPQGVKLNGVQPAIDSTGRASNVFRRVRARVQLQTPLESQLYPRATVDTTQDFCKDFGISGSEFIDGNCPVTP